MNILAAAINSALTGGSLGSLSFNAPLTHSLVPTRSTDPAYTFTRASSATIIDHEGIIRTCIPNEARFKGARRVENLFLGSWVKGATVVVTEVEDTYELTNLGADQFANGMYFTAMDGLSIAGRTYTHKFAIKALVPEDVGETISIRFYRASGTPAVGSPPATITLTSAFQEFTCDFPLAGTGANVGLRAFIYGGTATQCVAKDVQFEDITGQVNQTPSEYVRIGVDHGANVDAVQYFLTENGNTVLNNVVTEGTGASITSEGYLSEELRANELAHSSDLTDAVWVQSGTVTSAVSSNIAPDGNPYTTLTNTGTIGGPNRILQGKTGITNTGQNIIVSAYLKKGTSDGCELRSYNSGPNDVTLRIDFTVTPPTLFVAGAGGYLADSAFIEEVKTDEYRIGFGLTLDGASTVYDFRISPTVSAGTVDVSMAQLEDGASFASSYIPTEVTTPIQRVADDLNYPLASIPTMDEFSFTLEVNAPLDGIGKWFINGNSPLDIYMTAADGIVFRVTTSTGNKYTDSPALSGTSNFKIAGSFSISGGRSRLAVNGVLGIENNLITGTAIALANDLSVGAEFGGSSNYSDVISNIQFYKKPLTDAKLQELST